MPFIPHTQEDIRTMLQAIGVEHIETLFEEIPSALCGRPPELPAPLSEMAVTRFMQTRAKQDESVLCFIGAGAYEHHLPAAVWEIASRGEFYTAYTPYQAEASQGTLQVLYEFQTMMAELTGMDVANSSLYDGASALGEAMLMAMRIGRKPTGKILVPATVNRRYRQTARTMVQNQGVELIDVPFCSADGHTVPEALAKFSGSEVTALVIQQPNFYGVLEEVDALTDWAHAQGALVIGVVNPTSLGLLQAPGMWGKRGADIACGEGQPLGAPLSSGGPYFGFLGCKQDHLRQMPGRIVGRTEDRVGNPGFVLTMQAREQHIRRAKATSNICTNQGLMTVAATIYLALLGPSGLKRTAVKCHENTKRLLAKLEALPGVTRTFSRPFFHEVLIGLPKPVPRVLEKLAAQGIAGGYAVETDCPMLKNGLLICSTETKVEEDLECFASALREALI